MWYLIVSFPDLGILTYFYKLKKTKLQWGPQEFWGSEKNGVFLSGSLGSTGNYFMGSGEQAHSSVDLGSPAKK